jgi:hypothetical protein
VCVYVCVCACVHIYADKQGGTQRLFFLEISSSFSEEKNVYPLLS